MKRLAAGALALTLLLSACGRGEPEENFLIYYAAPGDSISTSALEGVPWNQKTSDVEKIFSALCLDPEKPMLESLIPRGTVLQSWTLSQGGLTLDLSGEYSTLSGVQLTIANYCIALTMCQLPAVDQVAITADGESMTGAEWLTEEQVMLSGGEGDTGQIYVRLYFPRADGMGIGSEERQLEITEDLTTLEAILAGLCAGPESRELSACLPGSSSDITLWIDGGICYVNLTEEWAEELENSPAGLETVLLCVTDSLCNLEEVSSVQFLMDGAAMDRWAEVQGDFPIFPDVSGVVEIDSQ